jgi:hypothetical protein
MQQAPAIMIQAVQVLPTVRPQAETATPPIPDWLCQYTRQIFDVLRGDQTLFIF